MIADTLPNTIAYMRAAENNLPSSSRSLTSQYHHDNREDLLRICRGRYVAETNRRDCAEREVERGDVATSEHRAARRPNARVRSVAVQVHRWRARVRLLQMFGCNVYIL